MWVKRNDRHTNNGLPKEKERTMWICLRLRAVLMFIVIEKKSFELNLRRRRREKSSETFSGRKYIDIAFFYVHRINYRAVSIFVCIDKFRLISIFFFFDFNCVVKWTFLHATQTLCETIEAQFYFIFCLGCRWF